MRGVARSARWNGGVVASLLSLMAVASCRQEQENGPCGGLTTGTCAYPMECVTVAATPEEKRICILPCQSTTLDCPPPGCCPSGSRCRGVDMIAKRVAPTDMPDQTNLKTFCVPSSYP